MAVVVLNGIEETRRHSPEWVVNGEGIEGGLDFRLKCPNCRAVFYRGAICWTAEAEQNPRPWDIRDELRRWEKKARPYVESFPCEQGV